MNVLEEVDFQSLTQEEHLTTKFVYDWRVKDFTNVDGSVCRKWLRRSRLVAREFSFWEKRDDTYSPATSTSILNLLPMLYLKALGEQQACGSKGDRSSVVLGTVDVKDAFLMVDQAIPMSVSLLGKTYKVCKNLPGQRLGAKAWYWSFREMLTKELGMSWCLEQPCLARNEHCCIMLHVDDVMFCGDASYWPDVFLQKLKDKYKISFSKLEDVGSEIPF